MSEFCRCGNRSKGSIGMLRLCYRCFAELAGWKANDKRVRQRCPVQLTDGGRDLSVTEWVPDCSSSPAAETPQENA